MSIKCSFLGDKSSLWEQSMHCSAVASACVTTFYHTAYIPGMVILEVA